MRWTPIVSAATLLLFGIIPALADDVMLDVSGGAYSVNDFGGFSVAGTGLSIEATNDFCCGGFSDILPGQSYTESFTAASAPGALETFEGDLGSTFFTGNGWLTWEFSFVIPTSAPPGSVFEIQVPATVTGYLDFCFASHIRRSVVLRAWRKPTRQRNNNRGRHGNSIFDVCGWCL